MMKTVPVAMTLAAVVALVGCGKPSVMPVADVTKANAVSLTSARKDVSGITLHLRGKLDGEAHVFADNWEKQKLSGVVDWKIYHDWFQPTCVLRYEPATVTSGSLTVEYRFHK